jgi:hypothetical protein
MNWMFFLLFCCSTNATATTEFNDTTLSSSSDSSSWWKDNWFWWIAAFCVVPFACGWCWVSIDSWIHHIDQYPSREAQAELQHYRQRQIVI